MLRKPTDDVGSLSSLPVRLLERVPPDDRLLPLERERPTEPEPLRVRDLLSPTRPLFPDRDRVRSTVPRELLEDLVRERTAPSLEPERLRVRELTRPLSVRDLVRASVPTRDVPE